MIKIADALGGVSRIGIDTAPIIYFIESNSLYDSCVTPIFEMIEQGKITGVTSVISLTEVLTLPIKLGQTQLYMQYRDLLMDSANLELIPVDRVIAERASLLRAQYGLRTPDAIQLAAAIESGCEAFLTNDSGLIRVTDISVISLGDLTS